MMGAVTTALDSLLEGFAAEPPVLDGRLRIGDRVRVPVKGQDSVVGRVVRPSDSKPATHLLVAPEGGGPHVEAAVKSATHDTPERHGRERAKRQAEFEAQSPQVPASGQGKPGPVRESILGELLEGFEDARHPRDFHGRFIHVGSKVRVMSGGEEGVLTHTVEAISGSRVTIRAPGKPSLGGGATRVASAGELVVHGASPQAVAPDVPTVQDHHGGFKVGDQIRYRTPSVVNGRVEGYSPYQGGSKVVRLARNGYLTVQDPKFGTTHDVHPRDVKHDALHPGYRGEQAQRAMAADRARIAREKAERAAAMPYAKSALERGQRPVGGAGVMASALHRQQEVAEIQRKTEAARAARNPKPKEKWVPEPGREAHFAGEGSGYIGKGKIVSREPSTGHLHVLLDDGRRGRVRADQAFRTQKEARQFARVPQEKAGWSAAAQLSGALGKKGRRGPRAAESERAGIGLLVEAFKAPAPPPVAGINAPSPGETVAQSMARGAASVRTARAELAANAAWNSSKHPRGAAGKFAYSTGGKRAHVGSSKHTSLSTKGYGNYVGVGARGALVQSIQRQLGIKADGVYGQQTRAAIMRFQTNHGLRVDGVIGQQTITALRGRSGAAKVAPGPLSVKTARVVKHKPRARAPVMIGGGVRIG